MLKNIVIRKTLVKVIACLLLALAFSQPSKAVSFSLDSIAEWGKFPRFCIGVYRWGDKFFNSYDSTYVKGTGTKFNVKLTSDSWLDYYRFVLPNIDDTSLENRYVDLVSRPSTSIGVHLTYLAVSVGYDMNVSSIFNGVKDARKRYQFGFNCALLGVEAYKETSEVGTRMTRFGDMKHLDIPFDGIRSDSWGIDAYYFFNNKRYSQAAAFSYSKIQLRSQGSFYAGLSVYSQNYDFNFSGLEKYLLDRLPTEWIDYHFTTKTQNYGLRLGYGYNWVFAKNWLLAGTISPTIGVKHGFVNSDTSKTSFSLYNHLKFSIVWNSGRWFAGAQASADTAIVSDRQSIFMGNDLNFTAAVGYRFNIW